MGQQKLNRTSDNNDATNASNDIAKSKGKIFQRFKINEIVFLSILSAVLIVATSVMPLVAELTRVVFGIAQLVTGLQLSFFITIALMRVRKPFTITIIMMLMGGLMLMMAFVMFLSNLFVLVVAETLVLLIFRGYQSNKACFFGGAIVPPLALVVPTCYNYITAPEVFMAVTANPFLVVGMTLAVITIGILGALLAVKVGSELIKSGVMKNG